MARAYLREFAEEERLVQQLIINRRILRDLSDPFSLPEGHFIDNYRLSKDLFEFLCEEISPFMRQKTRRHALRLDTEVLAAISFLANGSYQKAVGKDQHSAMSQAALSNCLADVVEALNQPEILTKYIKFPGIQAQRYRVMTGFMAKHNFPGVLGCIDGTHVAIIRPNDHEEVYFNRKSYHSLNVLAICDSDLQILHVDASFGGASHDSHVWRSCPVRQHMQTLYEGGELCWLLGDSGYAQRPWLMTPVLGAAPDSPEEYYTRQHCSTRNTIERCFGVLKSRWRCLLAHRVLHYDPVKAGKIVNACVVLHNLTNKANLPIPELEDEERRRDLERQIPRQLRVRQGQTERDALIQRLWNSR